MLRIIYVVLFVLVGLCTPFSSIEAAEQSKVSTAPKTNNGKKWRIGYIEGGSYRDYQGNLKAFITSLAELGWIEKKPFPETRDKMETHTIWNWMADNVQSNYTDFAADAYWSSGWDKKLREKNKENVIARLNNKKDIDIMLAFGTEAGQDIANNNHSVPTMLFSISDPLKSGIIRSPDDSGFDHIHARVDPKRYERQIRLFHKIIGFKKMGIAFQNTKEGRSYAGIDYVKKHAGEAGFEVLECYNSYKISNQREMENGLLKCHQKLAPNIDAFFITPHAAMNSRSASKLLEPFFKHKIPTYSLSDYDLVKYGVLFSIAKPDFEDFGMFHAKIFAKILNGAKPRDLPQVFESPAQIAINLETAKKIGFFIPTDILAGAKEIHKHIESVD